VTDDNTAPLTPAPNALAANPDDLTANDLMWLLSDVSAVGNEDRRQQARETLARYGLNERSALRLLRKKRKRREIKI
jgi:hypothetical protein